MPLDPAQARFQKFCWLVLMGTLAVILWGAVVRATGSGAGCGDHWPLCNGVIVPRAPAVETVIEFIHRLTSGLALLGTVVLVWGARRCWPAGHQVRWAAWISLGFMLTEAAVGASLVLLELVGGNDSGLRALVMAVHLLNTFLLLASLTLTAWWSGGHAPPEWRRRPWVAAGLLLGMLAVAIVGATGAVTALGDTLFPAESLAEGLSQDFSPTAHFLVRLRVFHPVAALFGALVLLVLSGALALRPGTAIARRFALGLGGLVLVQVGAGFANLVLLAPTWLQIVHLLLADFLWISLVLLACTSLASSTAHAAERTIRSGQEERDVSPRRRPPMQ